MTTDSKAVQGDWAEQIARAAMGRHAVDVVALDEVASQLRAAEHRGYTMGHKAGDDFRSAALASTAGAGAWRPMNTAPSDTPIVARHKPNSRTPHGWVATISRAPEDPDERVGGLDTILHYNGNALMRGFHGVWVGWMYPEEFAALALSAGTLSVGWDGARDAFARIVEDRAWTAEHGEPRAACLRAAADIRQAKAPAVPASPRSGAGEGEELTETPLAIVHRWANWIAGATDSGEIPEGTPEQRQMLFADLRKVVSALSQGGGAGRSERAVEIRELSEKATEGEGRVPAAPGSREPSPSVSASGFDPSRDEAYDYAVQLATSLWREHWSAKSPNWLPLLDLVGVLTQIDNMTAGLVPKTASDQSTGEGKCPICGETAPDPASLCIPRLIGTAKAGEPCDYSREGEARFADEIGAEKAEKLNAVMRATIIVPDEPSVAQEAGEIGGCRDEN